MADIFEEAKRQLNLRRDRVVWPLARFDVHKFGAHGAVRTTPEEGGCMQNKYPCTHHGADLSALPGEPVYAPHDGWVLESSVVSGMLEPPFSGYEPGVVLIAHDDIDDSWWSRSHISMREALRWRSVVRPSMMSGRYSLLGHVVPLYPGIKLPDDVRNPAGDHWHALEDGTLIMLGNAEAVVPGREVLKEGGDVLPGVKRRYVNAGDPIGFVSDKAHVHWEIRNSPLAGKAGRFDPISTWKQLYQMELPAGARVAVTKGGGGGAGILLLLAMAAGGKKRERTKRARRARR